MAKSSGTTRSSTKGSPRGLTEAIPFTDYVRQVNQASFKRVDAGEYELTMPNGDTGTMYSRERFGNEDWHASVMYKGGESVNLGWFNSQENAEKAIKDELKKLRT